jgi:hypothetical protein
VQSDSVDAVVGDDAAAPASTSLVSAPGPSDALLDDAIQRASGQRRFARSEALLVAAMTMKRLRDATAQGDWDGVQEQLSHLQDAGVNLPDACKGEVDAMVVLSSNAVAVNSLRDAMATGGVREVQGVVDVSSVNVAPLLVAVQRAAKVAAKSPELTRLLKAATAVSGARQAVIAERWDDALAVVDAVGADVPGEAGAELQIIRNEAQNRKCEADFVSALRSNRGAASGAGGSGSGSGSDALVVAGEEAAHDGITQLRAVTAAAVRVAHPSPRLQVFVEVGKAMLALRERTAAGDWRGVAAAFGTHSVLQKWCGVVWPATTAVGSRDTNALTLSDLPAATVPTAKPALPRADSSSRSVTTVATPAVESVHTSVAMKSVERLCAKEVSDAYQSLRCRLAVEELSQAMRSDSVSLPVPAPARLRRHGVTKTQQQVHGVERQRAVADKNLQRRARRESVNNDSAQQRRAP